MLFEFLIHGTAPNMKVSVVPTLVALIEDHWFGSPFGVVSKVKLTSGEIYLSDEKRSDLVERLNTLLDKG